MVQKYIFLIALISIFSCNQKVKDTGTDLMKYGIPYTLQAPKDVTISKVGSGNLADVNVKNNDGYDIQIFMGNAFSTDLIKLKQQKKDQVTAHPEFSKIVEEYEEGFIYEKKNYLSERSFDFSIIKIMGDKEINFQGGNSKPFNEAEVKKMVQSITIQK